MFFESARPDGLAYIFQQHSNSRYTPLNVIEVPHKFIKFKLRSGYIESTKQYIHISSLLHRASTQLHDHTHPQHQSSLLRNTRLLNNLLPFPRIQLDLHILKTPLHP